MDISSYLPLLRRAQHSLRVSLCTVTTTKSSMIRIRGRVLERLVNYDAIDTLLFG